MIGADVVAFCKATSAINTPLGGNIWREAAPANTLPALVATIISQTAQYDFDGADGFETVRAQLDVLAVSSTARDTLVAAIDGVLNGYAGAMGAVSAALVTRLNLLEQSEVSGDRRVWRSIIDYQIRYRS